MIPLYSIRFEWPDGTSLEIVDEKTESGEKVTFPNPVNVAFKAKDESRLTPGLLFQVDPDGFYETLRLKENSNYDILICIKGTIEDSLKNKRNSHGGWPFQEERLHYVWKPNSQRVWKQERREESTWTVISGKINFQSHVGVVNLTILKDQELLAEVACEKIDYFSDFKLLLKEVAEDYIELLFDIEKTSAQKLDAVDLSKVHPSALLFHLRRMMEPHELPLAIESIVGNPHSKIIEQKQLKSPERTSNIDLRHLVKNAGKLPYQEKGSLKNLFQGCSPLLISERTRRETYDTAENRYVKAFLQSLHSIVDRLEILLDNSKTQKRVSLREVREWKNKVLTWLHFPIWREVGTLSTVPSNSQVLQKRQGYREILESEIILSYGLQLSWERAQEIASTLGEIRPIFELYEYWCFFALRKALITICGTGSVSNISLYEKSERSIDIQLRQGRSSQLDFQYQGKDKLADLSLFYHRSFKSGMPYEEFEGVSYSTEFHPDYSIRISIPDSESHWLHFDAKYRLNLTELERQLARPAIAEIEIELDRSILNTSSKASKSENFPNYNGDKDLYKRPDLYKMHTYRDAIVGSRGAYILFPWYQQSQKFFVLHKAASYRSIFEIPSVGALSLSPKSKADHIRQLVEFLRNILNRLTDDNFTYKDVEGY